MASFTYTAKDTDGNVQKGTVTASSKAIAVSSLNAKHLTPIIVKEGEGKSFAKMEIKLPSSGKIKSKDIVVFTRQFATMINAGVPLMKALSTMQQQTDSPALAKAMEKVVSDVQGGTALADALEAHPKAFSPVYISMIRAGEAGGILDQIMERLAVQEERDAEIRGKLKSAMIYPGVITTITLGALVFLMTGIIPKFETIFNDMGAELPPHTQFLINLSNFMIEQGFLLIGITTAAIFGLFRFVRTDHGKHLLHRLLIKLPVFGVIIVKVNVARFARTFSSMVGAGVSVVEALKVTSHSLSNVIIRDALNDAAKEITNGVPISAAIESKGVFPPIVNQMTAIGEETGQVDVVLTKVAEFYEKEVERAIAGLTSIIEPLLIVVLGGVVGLIVASVFGPISELGSAI